ncbi:unnamed protein product [Microthlaspi erraticum]|uniref:MATH domain-containing protein n=1 Tax=Microthlaspi erraticum TaxID=1685480 RepID=A0A6D2LL20_9BRAS|nr:unnamed protein product [Microthlaspi erraticum]
MEKKVTCVFGNFPLYDTKKHYSSPFKLAGCNWCLVAVSNGYTKDSYLSVYLELAPGPLPPRWRRNVKFSLTLERNPGFGLCVSNKTLGREGCFDAENDSWGFEEFLPLSELWGYVVNFELSFIVELDVFPEEPVKIIEPLSCRERNQDDDDASVTRSQGTDTSCQVAQNTENPSNKILDETCGTGFNTVASVTQTGNDVLKEEIQRLKETMNVNGFEVSSSQVESVRRIFERHPDIAVEFHAKNQQLRNTCMNFLLSLIQTLCQSLEELSNEDLVEADIALTYLKEAGFKVDWLEKKLDQMKDKKENEQSVLARLQEIEENLKELKQKCSDLDALAGEGKAELSATRTALSFDDLV